MIRALRAQVYTGLTLMKVSTLRALSPADGRYASKVESLRDIFSEYGLIRFRILVEIRWLQCIADDADIAELGPLSSVMKDVLNHIVDDFSLDDAERVKNIEATTLTIGESQALATKHLAQHLGFFSLVGDNRLLMSVDPTREHQHQKLPPESTTVSIAWALLNLE